jgi:hypothetical protein
VIETFWLLPTFIAGMVIGAETYRRWFYDRVITAAKTVCEAEYRRLLEGARHYHEVAEEGLREIERLKGHAQEICDGALKQVDAAVEKLRAHGR